MTLRWNTTFKGAEQEISAAPHIPGAKYTITDTPDAEPRFRVHFEKQNTRSPIGTADTREEAEKIANDHR